MEPRHRKAIVIFDIPRSVDADDVAGFISDALESMGGCRHPEDPLFESLSIKSVTIGGVKYINPKPKKF